MKKTDRPLSPHLQVYKPQLTSILSIFHRMTGVFLSLVAVGFVLWLMSLAHSPECFAWAHGWIGSWFGEVILFGATYAFFYHFANGIRHLFWDAGYGFELETVYRSGWAVVITSVALTFLTWILALIMMGS